MDRLEAMHVFVTVADLRGFAPAARKLQLSPSAVTRLIEARSDEELARLMTNLAGHDLPSLLEAFGKVDILVNNAGITRDDLIMRMSLDDWRDVLETSR